jgi:hypothetical protein
MVDKKRLSRLAEPSTRLRSRRWLLPGRIKSALILGLSIRGRRCRDLSGRIWMVSGNIEMLQVWVKWRTRRLGRNLDRRCSFRLAWRADCRVSSNRGFPAFRTRLTILVQGFRENIHCIRGSPLRSMFLPSGRGIMFFSTSGRLIMKRRCLSMARKPVSTAEDTFASL